MNYRRSSIISLAVLVLAALWLVVTSNWSLLGFANLLFLCCLFFLIIGIFLWVCSSGFFDTFQRSMKKAVHRDTTAYVKLSEVGRSFPFWLAPAGILLLASLIALGLSFLKN